jgi:hypothetical protein
VREFHALHSHFKAAWEPDGPATNSMRAGCLSGVLHPPNCCAVQHIKGRFCAKFFVTTLRRLV